MGITDDEALSEHDELEPGEGYRLGQLDGFKRQLPDPDPVETREWTAALDGVVLTHGHERADFLLRKLLKRARMLHIGLPGLVQSRYINTISPEQEPPFQGDEEMEHRIRRIIRWNAVVMVLRANHAVPRPRRAPGHLRLERLALRDGLQPLLPRQGRRARRPGLLPGPRRARHLRPRLPAGPHQRAAARPLPPGGRRARALLLPAPATHARLLGVPHGLDGTGPAQRGLPGALQPLPARPRLRRHLEAARLGLPRRRRDGRAGVAPAGSRSRAARGSTT